MEAGIVKTKYTYKLQLIIPITKRNFNKYTSTKQNLFKIQVVSF